MKPGVAVTLIVMGTLAVLAPIVADYLYQGRMIEFATVRPTITYNRGDWQLSSLYSFGCYTLGVVMVVVGIAGSGLFRSMPPPQ